MTPVTPPNPAAPSARVEPALDQRSQWFTDHKIALTIALMLALGSCIMAGLLWSKLETVQELLARQTTDARLQISETKSALRRAEEQAREAMVRVNLAESKITELNLQRGQLEQMLQNLNQTRDENLVSELDASLRLAQQQTQLTGSLQPLLAALRATEQRLDKQAMPKFTRLQRAIEHDLERLTAAGVPDTPSLMLQLDDLISLIDALPLKNAIGTEPATMPATMPVAAWSWQQAVSGQWWGRFLADIWHDIAKLVRVSRVDHTDTLLIAPEQANFLRQNLKLRLLNARLSILSRQFESAFTDLHNTQRDLNRYFDTSGRVGKQLVEHLGQMQKEVRQVKLPRIDESFAALEILAAGR